MHINCTYEIKDNYTFSKSKSKSAKKCVQNALKCTTRLICINYIFKKKNKVTRAKQLNSKLANMKAKPRKNNYYK